ncbi:hypothetical protein V6N13_005145 [Hibiscus sabdariffa]|uniref:Uncharacterized protein n=1 Tax=Hibiscus sabdariffa TaxID=183260 RepID=A0ABR2NHP4_9ROSI
MSEVDRIGVEAFKEVNQDNLHVDESEAAIGITSTPSVPSEEMENITARVRTMNLNTVFLRTSGKRKILQPSS